MNDFIILHDRSGRHHIATKAVQVVAFRQLASQRWTSLSQDFRPETAPLEMLLPGASRVTSMLMWSVSYSNPSNDFSCLLMSTH